MKLKANKNFKDKSLNILNNKKTILRKNLSVNPLLVNFPSPNKSKNNNLKFIGNNSLKTKKRFEIKANIINNNQTKTNPLNFFLKNKKIKDINTSKLTLKSTISSNKISKEWLNPVYFNDNTHLKNLTEKIKDNEYQNKYLILNFIKIINLNNENYIKNYNKIFSYMFSEIWNNYLKNNDKENKFTWRKENNKIFNYFKNIIDIENKVLLIKNTIKIYNNILFLMEIEKKSIINKVNLDNNNNLIKKFKELKIKNYWLKKEKKKIETEIKLDNLYFIKNYKNKFINHSKSNLEELNIFLAEKPQYLNEMLLNCKDKLKLKIHKLNDQIKKN